MRHACPPRLSELAILTTARIWDAAYEWHAHLQPAREAGLSEVIIIALGEDTTPAFHSPDEELVYSFTRELNLTRTVSDDEPSPNSGRTPPSIWLVFLAITA